MPTMTPDLVIAQIVSVLNGVSGIGVVHDYRRVVKRQEDIHSLYLSGSVINAAMVTWTNAPTTITDFGSPTAAGAYTTLVFAVDVLYGIDDANASEKTFRALVWSILGAMNSRGNLAASAGVSHQERAVVEELGYLDLAGVVLTHYARLRIAFRGRVSP